MTFRLGKTKIHITFLFAAGAAALTGIGAGRLFLRLFSAACLHETVHFSLLCAFRCPPRALTVGFFGMRLPADTARSLSYWQEGLCAIAAPLANLLCGAVLWGVGWREAAVIHLSLGILNLLPLRMLDGGRALSCLLLQHSPPQRAERVLAVAECIVVPMLLLFVFFCLLRNPRNYTALLFAVYLVLLLFFRK